MYSVVFYYSLPCFVVHGLLFYDNTYTFMFSEPLDSSNEMAINIPVKEEKQDFSFEADIKVFSI